MASKRHVLFNLAIIIIPWLSLIFIGKRSIKRYSLASVIVCYFETINHLYGHKRKWWRFYDKQNFFIRDELPFDIGPYMPLSMWILKISYGNFKKFVLINAFANGLFTFVGMPLFKRMKIVGVNRLNYFQFFIYIHYKAYILYAIQYLLERTGLIDKRAEELT